MITHSDNRRPNRYNAARDASAAEERLSGCRQQQPITPRWSMPLRTVTKWGIAAVAIAYVVQTLILHGSP